MRPRFDVVLVQPNITWVYDPFEHLGLAYLAAALRRERFSVKIVDAVLLHLSMAELYAELDRYEIGVLGVTLVSHGYLVTTRFLRHYRDRHPGTRIAAGGHFATFAAEKILAHTDVFDVIVLGEGEHTFADYCRAELRGEEPVLRDVARPGQLVERSHERILDMDALAFPARDNLRLAMGRGAHPGITSSRGCYARCAFCTVHNFYTAKNGPRWVARSIGNIIAELESLHEQIPLEHFMFIDDNFMGPGPAGRARALEFAQAYQRSGLPMTFHIDCRANDMSEEVIAALREVGLRSIFVGIESLAKRDLIAYRKGLKQEANWEAVRIIKKFDLEYTLSMIMFNPETDQESILENIAFLESVEYFPRNPVSILNLYEGTDLNERYAEYLWGPFWDYRFRFARPTTERIYAEAVRFCKDTLPLERELSLRTGGGVAQRRELHQLRLRFLEDLTRRIDAEDVAAVRARWDARVAELRLRFESGAPARIEDSRAGIDRIYLTGSPADVPVAAACEPHLTAS